MSSQPTFRRSGRRRGRAAHRVVGQLATQLGWFVIECLKPLEALAIERRIDDGIDVASGVGNALQRDAMRLANAATPDERLLYETEAEGTPFGSVYSILMPEEEAQLSDDFGGEAKGAIHQQRPARTQTEHICDSRAIQNQRELSGTSTYESPRLTFVRRSMQMSRDAAKGGLLRRDWLFHQKAREHRGGCFVKPLFEEGINFFF
jgi:hypothetical protein